MKIFHGVLTVLILSVIFIAQNLNAQQNPDASESATDNQQPTAETTAENQQAPQPAVVEETADAVEAAAAEATKTATDAATTATEETTAAVEDAAAAVEDAAAEAEEATSSLLTGDLPDLQSEELPQADELVPDETLLIEAPSYVPSYDEIVRQSQDVIQEYSEPGLEMRQNIELRKARTKVLNDPEVQAARQFALDQKFYPEQQQAWQQYFEMLYGRMSKLEPELKDIIAEEKAAELKRIGMATKEVEEAQQ